MKQKEIKLATYTAKLMFNIPLPECISSTEEINLNEGSFCSSLSPKNVMRCLTFGSIFKLVREIKITAYDRMINSVHQVHDALEDATSQPMGSQRTKRGWGADLLSSITGLASQDQLQSVLNVLRRIELGVHKASQMFGEGTRNLVAAFQVNQKRLNRVQKILGIYRESLEGITQHIFGQLERDRMERALMLKLMKLMLESQYHLADADSLYAATQLLLSGYLPHFFISHEDMAIALSEVKNHLLMTDPHMKLVREDFVFYYHSADFKPFLDRKGNKSNPSHFTG